LFLGSYRSPSSTVWPGPRPTSIPSGILMHPAVWPQQKWAENWGYAPILGRGSWDPIYHNVAWTEAHFHTKCHLDPSRRLATIDIGRKLGVLPPFWDGVPGSPSNTMSLGPRPTSLPSGILIHPAIWHNRYGPKTGSCAPLGEGELGPHLTQCGHGHLDPFYRLATIHRHRQVRQTDNGLIT